MITIRNKRIVRVEAIHFFLKNDERGPVQTKQNRIELRRVLTLTIGYANI